MFYSELWLISTPSTSTGIVLVPDALAIADVTQIWHTKNQYNSNCNKNCGHPKIVEESLVHESIVGLAFHHGQVTVVLGTFFFFTSHQFTKFCLTLCRGGCAERASMNGDGELSSNDHDTKTSLEDKCAALRRKILDIQRKRQQVHELTENETSQHLTEWLIRREVAERNRRLAINEYQSAVTSMNCRRRWLNFADEWNVTNDCFHIWHRGPFGTINGLRLASEVPSLPSTPAKDDSGVATSDGSKAASTTNLPVTSPVGTGSREASPPNGHSQDVPDSWRVPWVEINSALGLLVLLLANLEKKPHSGITYHNKLVPQGSTSKIGIRKGESVTFYNLFSDDSFQFFGKRSFNIALNGLVRCLSDAASAVEKIDRTMTMPYPIECDATGVYTIGGLSVSYAPEGELWTRAMKYVLTDSKWLVAFSTKHVDR